MTPPGLKILTFALQDWPRSGAPSTRTSKPKVRTGCVTCKRRRVKCDETKPTCQNCLKRRVACEGYKPGREQKSHPVAMVVPTAGSPLLIEPNYQGLVFANQLQKDHFDTWLSFTNATLIFPSALLTETIPQLARSDPAVRNAAFALGAAVLGSNTRAQRLRGGGPFYADALEYYNRALCLTAKSPATEETFSRVLATCLLFFIFEAFHGNRRAALIHLNHGTNILHQYERRAGAKRTPLLEGIVAAFQRLTMQSWSHNGDHPEETEERAPWCCRGRAERYAVEEMPDAFDDLDEAHRWWEVTQHHVIHHAPLLIGFRVQGAGNKTTAIPANQSLPVSAPRVKGFMRFLTRWQAGFLPLVDTARRDGSERGDAEYLKLLGLQIHSAYLSIPVKTANYTDAEALASLTPVFRRLVSLSREFLTVTRQSRAAEAGEVFTVDSSSPTWPLGAASFLCVDADVRADAVRLLRGFPRRDGLWDTRTYVAMLNEYKDAKQAIVSRVGGEEVEEPQHLFDYEVVYDEKSVAWVKTVDDTSVVEREKLEYRIELS